MTITLYNNSSESINISKDISEIVTLTGNLRESSSIMSPSILFQDISIDQITQCNYAYIADFKRYYFITEAVLERSNLVRLNMRCDVLMTYADQIKANTGVIARQENNWNLYLNDGVFKVYQNPIIKTQLFPNGFTGESFVLAIAGAGD